MVSTRARHNYLLKVGKEMEMLENYTVIVSISVETAVEDLRAEFAELLKLERVLDRGLQ